MFGFMFGDVAQGLVIALAGWMLRTRQSALRLLVPGGLVAVVFGLAFGSVFAREDVLPALWVRPLESPLLVLGSALAFGVVVITLGQLLDALQHSWRGQLGRWLASPAGVLAAYLGIVCAGFDARTLWLLPIGIAWSLLGAAAIASKDRAAAFGQAAGEGRRAHVAARGEHDLVRARGRIRTGALRPVHRRRRHGRSGGPAVTGPC